MTNGDTPKSEELFGDDRSKARWETVYRQGLARFGNGQDGDFNPDFELRLRIIRDLLGLNPQIWSDKVFAQLTRGHDGDNANSRFNRVKNQAQLKLDSEMAAMLAGVVSYILAVEPLWPAKPTERQLAEVIGWIETTTDDPGGRFLASDLFADLLTMTRRLSELVTAQQYGEAPEALREKAHAEIIQRLTTPYDIVDRRRLVVNPTGLRPAGAARFGSELISYGAPREWLPLEFRPGASIEYGLSQRLKTPCQGWLATVRDCRRSDAEYVWHSGWEDVIRWLPGGAFPLPQGEDIRVPTSAANVVTNIPGHFHVFLFVEPAGSTYLADILDPYGGIPSVGGYLNLTRDAAALKDRQIEVFASSYIVPA